MQLKSIQIQRNMLVIFSFILLTKDLRCNVILLKAKVFVLQNLGLFNFRK